MPEDLWRRTQILVNVLYAFLKFLNKLFPVEVYQHFLKLFINTVASPNVRKKLVSYLKARWYSVPLVTDPVYMDVIPQLKWKRCPATCGNIFPPVKAKNGHNSSGCGKYKHNEMARRFRGFHAHGVGKIIQKHLYFIYTSICLIKIYLICFKWLLTLNLLKNPTKK